jgi:hypothetical protein
VNDPSRFLLTFALHPSPIYLYPYTGQNASTRSALRHDEIISSLPLPTPSSSADSADSPGQAHSCPAPTYSPLSPHSHRPRTSARSPGPWQSSSACRRGLGRCRLWRRPERPSTPFEGLTFGSEVALVRSASLFQRKDMVAIVVVGGGGDRSGWVA